MKSSISGVRNFYKNVLNILLYVSPLVSKDYPFIVDNLGDVVKEEIPSLIIYYVQIWDLRTVSRPGNSIWPTNCALTPYHIFQYELPLYFSNFKISL